jgi:glycosyltransferase involved in cell wall biosynthesis
MLANQAMSDRDPDRPRAKIDVMLPTSVVMPTYNRRDFLPELLPPLLRDPRLLELIIVVDGARDGSIELVRRLAVDEDRLVPVFIDNSGEDAARLAGVRRARGEIVLLIDDDVQASEGLVSAHSRRHDERDHLLVVGYMPVADPVSVGERLYSDRYETVCRHWRACPDEVLRTFWAGNFSSRRSDYLKLATVPTRYRYDFHADRAFGFRAFEAGLHGVFDPECRAVHNYRRPASGLARDARNQGLSLIRLHEEFPKLSPALQRNQFTWYLPGYQAPFVDLCRRPRAAASASAFLRAITSVADRVGAPKAAELATLMMTIERQRGAIDACRLMRSDGLARGSDLRQTSL